MRLQSTGRVAERAEEEREYDRGPRWVRRLLVAGTLVVVLIVGGHLLWSGRSRTLLDRQVAEYRAAGEPIELADFSNTGVADGDNAAILLREAARIDETTEAWKAYAKLPDDIALPLTDEEAAAIEAVVNESASTFDLVDEAMGRPKVDWKLPYGSPVIQILLPDLNQQRQLARLMAHRAMLNYRKGDHAAAVRDMRRALFIGRAVGHQPFLVGYLVSVAINAMSADVLATMSPGLKVGKGPGDVPPDELRAVIAELLDENAVRESYRRGLDGERMMQLDTARSVAEGKLSLAQLSAPRPGGVTNNALDAAVGFLARPVALSDGLLMIRHTTAVQRAFDASPDWPTLTATTPANPKELNTGLRHVLARMMLPSFERASLTAFRHLAERRMTAIALAARWYAVEHDGRLPAKLEDLADGKYLSSVPLDPFAASARPLRLVNDPVKPFVYSVGEDGGDDGGSEEATELHKRMNVQTLGRWDRLDAVLHLTLQPRPEPEPKPETLDPMSELSDGVGDLGIAPTTVPATAPADSL